MNARINRWLGLVVLLVATGAWPTRGQTPQPQTITWTGTTNAILTLNRPYPLGAVSSSGLPVNAKILTGPAVLENGAITITNKGTVWVTAEQAGSETFASVSNSRSINVRKTFFYPLASIDIPIPQDFYRPPQRLQLDGNRAYFLDGQLGLRVFDISNPSKVESIPSGFSADPVGLCRIDGGTAFQIVPVTRPNGEQHMEIQSSDLNDPLQPLLLGRLTISDQVTQLRVGGGRGFLTTVNRQLHVIDLRDPRNMRLLGACGIQEDAVSLEVGRRHAYVLARSGLLEIVDVGNTAFPKPVGTYRLPFQASNLKLLGEDACVVVGNGLMQTVDVSDPLAPKAASALIGGDVSRIFEVTGDTAYGTGAGVDAYDMSNRSLPLRAGGIDDNFYALELAVAGDLAVVHCLNPFSAYNTKLRVFQMKLAYSNPFEFGSTNAPLYAAITNQFLKLPQTSGNGQPVSYTVLSGPARIEADKLVFTGPGPVYLHGEQPDDGLYLPVNATWTISVYRLAQSLGWNGPTNEFLELNHAYPVGASSSAGLPVSIKVIGPAELSKGMLTVTNAGTVWVTAEVVGDPVFEDARESRSFNMRRASFDLVGQVGTAGSAMSAQVVGNLAYLAAKDAGVEIVDVTDPSKMVRVGSVSTGGSAYRLKVLGRHAFVAAEGAGLQVVDVGDATHPKLVGGVDTGGAAYGVDVEGTLAFVADYQSGLQILDVSDPEHPMKAGRLAMETPAIGVQVRGGRAFVAGGAIWNDSTKIVGGLETIDVSDPANPKRLSRLNTFGSARVPWLRDELAFIADDWAGLHVIDVRDPAKPMRVGNADTPDHAQDVRVAGDYAAVADYGDGLQLIDVSNPALPKLVGSVDTDGLAMGVEVAGDITYVADGVGGLKAFKRRFGFANSYEFSPPKEVSATDGPITLPATSGNGKSVDYTVVSGPAKIEGRRLVLTGAGLIRLRAEQADDGQFLPVRREWTIQATIVTQYLSWQGAEAHFLKPAVPHALSASASSGLPVSLAVERGSAILDSEGITVSGMGEVVVLAHQEGNAFYQPAESRASFHVQRVRSRLVGSISTSGDPVALQVVNNRAYIAGKDGLEVFDVRNPAEPVKMGGIGASTWLNGLHVVDGFAYLADAGGGLLVIDVHDPAHLTKVGAHGNIGMTQRVFSEGGFAHVTSWGGGLRIFDVRDPASAKAAGQIDLGQPNALQVIQGHAYVCTEGYGLHIVDVHDPYDPRYEGGIDTENAVAVQVVGSLAFLADGGAGLQVIDVGDQANPSRVGGIGGFRSGNSVQVEGDRCYESVACFLQPQGASGLVQVPPCVGGLVVVDIGIPSQPVVIGGLEVVGTDYFAWVLGKFAYLGGYNASISIYELEVPFNQALTNRFSPQHAFQSQPLAGFAGSTSGLPVALSVLSGPARMEEGQLVLTGLGEVKLRAEQAGNDEFLPASTEWTITVTLPQIGARVVEGAVELQWAAGLEGVELQLRESWSGGSGWMGAAGEQIVAGGEVRVRVQPNTSERYYRLIKH